MLIIRRFVLKTAKHAFKFRSRDYCSQETDGKKWRIVFFGTDGFALQSLKRLHKAMQEGMAVKELAVVVPAPKPNPCQVAKYASQHSIPISIWPLSKEEWNGEQSTRWDLGVVASFGHLIPKRVISTFPLGMLNVHASLLPRWRGAAPIIHAIMNGDEETGVTIMRIKPFRFDVGDIVLQERIPIDERVTAPELTDRLAEAGAGLLFRCVSHLQHHLDRSVPQPSEGVTLAPKVDTQLSHVDWSTLSASQVYNRWRATRHLFKLQTSFHGEVVKLDGAGIAEPERSAGPESGEQSPPPGGIRVDRRRNLLLVRCREGWASFSRVTLARRPVMSAVDFANGYLTKRPAHQHLFTPTTSTS